MPAFAQKGKTLTNDDFPSGQRSDAKTTDEKDKEAAAKGDKDTAKDDKDAKTEKDPAKAEKLKKEQDWQKKAADTDKKIKELDQQKTQAELAAQDIRNRLRNANPQEFDALSQQLKNAEQKLQDLNNKYSEAQKSGEQYKKEGETQGYKAKSEDVPKTTADGRPNKDYYTKSYSDLTQKQNLAASKIQMYQNRLNEAQQRAYQGRSGNPNRVGSSYYTDPEIKKTIEESQKEIQKAQEEYQKTSTALEQLQRDARSKGVPIK
jgi:chromosome segregation ATPase